MDSYDQEVDLLVFGSGVAGLTAALVGTREGLSVLLCEKSERLGGTTATSGGTVWIPGSTQAARAGIHDTAESVRKYLKGELGNRYSHDMIEAFLGSGPEVLDYLERHTEVAFDVVPNPDYHSDRPGGLITGRALTAKPFDGRKLGSAFAWIRPPKAIYLVLGGMMVGRREVPILLQPFASWNAFSRVAKMVSRHMLDRLRYPRGTRLLIGNALVARFVSSLLAYNAAFSRGTRLISLIAKDSAVTGAVVESDGKRMRIRARKGVVLATGGITQNAELMRDLMGDHQQSYTMTAEENTGGGVAAALDIGAAVDADMMTPAFWSPASAITHPDGAQTVWIHGHMDRAKPGLLAVNSAGRRFVNEADSYHDFVVAMFEANKHAPSIPSYLICDHRFIKTYGLGMIRPRYGRLAHFIDAGYLMTGDGIAELAAQIGVDPEALEQTVSQYNSSARSGVDRAFGRGSSAFNRFSGDPSNQPNPCLAPVVKPPFYAMAVYPASIGATVGLKTDPDARVIDVNGTTIQGLYACGNDMASIMRGHYPGPGVTLGPGMVFAYRAVRHATHGSAMAETTDEAA